MRIMYYNIIIIKTKNKYAVVFLSLLMKLIKNKLNKNKYFRRSIIAR